MWQKYYHRFAGGIDLGYHDGLSQYDPKLAAKLKQNVAQFSAYKEAAFKRDISALLGKNREEFMAEAAKISDLYHKAWMNTEYHHTVAAANMTARWQKFQERKHLYPNLRYIAVQDERTRAEHAKWHGTILPIDHPFWDTHLPPNDWGCRCGVTQTDEEVTNPPGGDAKDTFANNPGKTGKVFVDSGYEKGLTPNERKQADVFSEMQKLTQPLITRYTAANGAAVKVSPFADTVDREANIKSLIVLADELKISSEINAHLNIDGWKNPELTIRNIKGDRVMPVSSNIRKAITNSFNDKLNRGGQLRDLENTVLLIDLSTYQLSTKIIEGAIAQTWGKFRHYDNLGSIFIEYRGNVVEIQKSGTPTFSDFRSKFRNVIKRESEK